jgi:hypothetical protein
LTGLAGSRVWFCAVEQITCAKEQVIPVSALYGVETIPHQLN